MTIEEFETKILKIPTRNYNYVLVPTKGYFKALNKLLKRRSVRPDQIFSATIILATNPSSPSLGSHKLKSSDLWSSSINHSHRIIWQYLEESAINLIKIGHHSDVY